MYIEENQQKVAEIATSLKNELVSAYKGTDLDYLDTPRVLANMLAGSSQDAIEPRCNYLEWTVDEFVTLSIKRALSHYQRLFEALVQKGAVSQETSFDVGGDVHVYVLSERKENGTISRPLVLETQNESFLVILSGPDTMRHLHIRQFWPDIQEVINGKTLLNAEALAEVAERNDLSLKDLAKLGAALLRVSDDVDGNYRPARPSLRYFMSGSLVPGSKSAGNGLCHGDGRDRGYVLSAIGIGREGLKVESILVNGYGTLCRAMSAMAYAVEVVTDVDD